jgi:hypothetical protein
MAPERSESHDRRLFLRPFLHSVNTARLKARREGVCYPSQPVASVLDLAVALLALMVCVTMGLLAWTLGVSIPAVLRRSRASLLQARLELAVAERRLRHAARARAEAIQDAAAQADDAGDEAQGTGDA